MNLRDFEYIVAVADLRSFSAAADKCCVSQPTLSAQVKKLEEQLGVAIFERTSKRVMPTEMGQRIIQSARRILSEVDAIKDSAAASQDPYGGRFRLGGFPTLACYLFPDLVPALMERMPNIRLVLVEEKSDVLVEKLRHGQIDAAILSLPVKDEFFHARHLFDDPFYMAVSDRHPLAGCNAIGTETLSQHKLLLLDEGHCLRDQALDVCEFMGAADEADLRATSLETLRQMVRADTGVTLMPEIAVGPRDSGVRYIPFTAPQPFRAIGLVRRKTCTRTAAFDAVCECIAQIRKSRTKTAACV